MGTAGWKRRGSARRSGSVPAETSHYLRATPQQMLQRVQISLSCFLREGALRGDVDRKSSSVPRCYATLGLAPIALEDLEQF